MTSPAPSTAAKQFAAILHQLQTRQASHSEIVQSNKPFIFKTLKKAGIHSLKVEYDGSGDSGQVDDPWIDKADDGVPENILETKKVKIAAASSYFDAEKKVWVNQVTEKMVSLKEAVVDLVYDWLEANAIGWENNDGAYGQFHFDVDEDKIFYEHNARITQIETDEGEL